MDARAGKQAIITLTTLLLAGFLYYSSDALPGSWYDFSLMITRTCLCEDINSSFNPSIDNPIILIRFRPYPISLTPKKALISFPQEKKRNPINMPELQLETKTKRNDQLSLCLYKFFILFYLFTSDQEGAISNIQAVRLMNLGKWTWFVLRCKTYKVNLRRFTSSFALNMPNV